MLINFSRIIFLSILLMFVNGCVSGLSKEACTNTNWYAKGYNEGRYGRPMDTQSKAIGVCVRYDVTMDQYTEGWDKGIQEFCTEENARKQGSVGLEPVDYCPRDLKQRYVRAWHQGLEEYCSTENGYSLGRSTSSYPEICREYNMTEFNLAYRQGLATHQQMKQLRHQIRQVRRNNEALQLTASNDLTPSEQAEITQLTKEIDELERKYAGLQSGNYKE